MLRKFISIIILLFVISVIVTVSLFMANTTDKKVITSSSNEESLLDVETSTSEFSNTNLETIDHDRLRETLNLSLRVIEAMLNKDYDYLEKVIAPSVSINKENNSITYGDAANEHPIMDDFDYKHFEFRAFIPEKNEVIIILGIYNISYEFIFVEGKSEHGNYLLKSLYTN